MSETNDDIDALLKSIEVSENEASDISESGELDDMRENSEESKQKKKDTDQTDDDLEIKTKIKEPTKEKCQPVGGTDTPKLSLLASIISLFHSISKKDNKPEGNEEVADFLEKSVEEEDEDEDEIIDLLNKNTVTEESITTGVKSSKNIIFMLLRYITLTIVVLLLISVVVFFFITGEKQDIPATEKIEVVDGSIGEIEDIFDSVTAENVLNDSIPDIEPKAESDIVITPEKSDTEVITTNLNPGINSPILFEVGEEKDDQPLNLDEDTTTPSEKVSSDELSGSSSFSTITPGIAPIEEVKITANTALNKVEKSEKTIINLQLEIQALRDQIKDQIPNEISDEKPNICVSAIVEPAKNCSKCMAWARVKYLEKWSYIGDGNTFLDYNVSIFGDNITLYKKINDKKFTYWSDKSCT